MRRYGPRTSYHVPPSCSLLCILIFKFILGGLGLCCAMLGSDNLNDDNHLRSFTTSYLNPMCNPLSQVIQQMHWSGTHGTLQGWFDVCQFKTEYQRNNKSKGLKNLRCFPNCGEAHQGNRFCGKAVTAKVSTGVWHELILFTEFVCLDENHPSTSIANETSKSCVMHREVSIGQIWSLSQMIALERTKENKFNPWVRGEQVSDSGNQMSYEFNRQHWGWHYGWNSNKHTCSSSHVLRCYVFAPFMGSHKNTSKYMCMEVFQSPAFVLFCRRRRKFMSNSLDEPIEHSQESEGAEPAGKRRRNESI